MLLYISTDFTRSGWSVLTPLRLCVNFSFCSDYIKSHEKMFDLLIFKIIRSWAENRAVHYIKS